MLSELGVNANALLAGAGVVGLAIGFGAQTLVKDLITGLFILIGDTVRVGDVVDLGGRAGVVEAISMRTMTLRAYNGDVHTIPYSSIDVVTNMTKDFSFYVFDLVVAYKEDVDRVIEVLREIDSQLRREWPYRRLMLEPLEIAGVDAFRELRAPLIKARTKVRAGEQWKVGREFNRRIKRRFDELGIELPVPQQQVVFGGSDAEDAAPLAARADAPGRRRGLMSGPVMRGAVALARAAGRMRRRGADDAPLRSARRCGAAAEPAADPLCGRVRRRPAARTCHPAAADLDSAAEGAAPATSRLAIRQRAEADRVKVEQALRAQGYFDGTVAFADRRRRRGAAREGLAAEVERLATRPEAVLGSRSSLARAIGSARWRSSSRKIRTTARRPAQGSGPRRRRAGTDAGRAGRRAEAARRRPQGRLRAGETRRARGRRRPRVARDGRHPAARSRPASRVRPGGLHGRRRHRPGLPARADPDRRPASATIPTPVTDGQNNLFDTNLFSTIVPRPAETLTDDQHLDLDYDLKQRPPRSIGAELNYETDIGPGLRLFWEHRNIFGAGERFRVEATAAEPQQSLTASLLKPDFLRPRQSLLTDATLRRDRLEAYDADSIGAGVGVEREITPQLKASLGTALRYARIEDLREPEQSFALLSFPAKIDWDFANDRFSPTQGGTLVSTLTPFVDLLGTDRNFLKGRLTTTRYLQLSAAPRFVLAACAAPIGALGGVSRDDVPADERFYAGGGGSIRGIGFELAGPLDDDDKPLGGRSVIEGSLELRTRFANNFGLAAFLDAGTVDTSSFPSFEERVLFGAGPSFRYFTPVGPIRFDIGFPLNPAQGCRLGLSGLFQYRTIVLSGRATGRPTGA